MTCDLAEKREDCLSDSMSGCLYPERVALLVPKGKSIKIREMPGSRRRQYYDQEIVMELSHTCSDIGLYLDSL